MQFIMIKQGIEANPTTYIGNVAADAAMHAPCRIVIEGEDVPEALKEFFVHEGASAADIHERMRRHVEMIEQQPQGGGHTGQEWSLKKVKVTSPRDSDR